MFLEAPVQFPEMLLLPAFDRGEASIVLTIDPATRLQVAKKEGGGGVNCGLSLIITMLHHDVCVSAFEPQLKMGDTKEKHKGRTYITTHVTMLRPQRNKKEEKVAIVGSLSSSRCCTMMYVCPPSNLSRRWVMRRETIEGGQT